jgi:hypothetical protein
MAMTEKKILTRHPRGKSGKNISVEKYEAVKRAMLSALRAGELTHDELTQALQGKLKGKFEGSIGWYGETVKLDLEARKTIVRTASRPQRYRLNA